MILGIIPARYASSRFPGKPLIDILDKSMIQRVYEQTIKAKCFSKVVIATDDERIFDHVKNFGGQVVMTSTKHMSGTDRCFEALKKTEGDFSYVINIQGDEPFINPEQIDELASVCNGETELATQMIAVDNYEMLFDKGEVKIALNNKMEALYFSRSVIPFLKNVDEKEWHLHHSYFRHVGMYAYRTDILEKICTLQASALEKSESLEQLRWLENGFKIKCVETKYESHCIDLPQDIEKIFKRMGLK